MPSADAIFLFCEVALSRTPKRVRWMEAHSPMAVTTLTAMTRKL